MFVKQLENTINFTENVNKAWRPKWGCKMIIIVSFYYWGTLSLYVVSSKANNIRINPTNCLINDTV